MSNITLQVGPVPAKKVAVISHERSGTHFLMNTIAYNFNFISAPWWNLDFELGLNFHSPQTLLNYIKPTEDKPVLNILKSHHAVAFFDGIMDYLTDQFHLFYIYRDPRDTLVSQWKLMKTYRDQGWEEGPISATIGEYIQAAPSGAMLRYQKQQHPSILHRWQDHVTSWIESSTIAPVCLIKYEELNLNFEATVGKIGAYLERSVPQQPHRPEKNKNVISPGQGQVNGWRNQLTPADNQFVVTIAGELMQRLGYQLDW
ncbi:MAG: sulfotransferase domain-containing protein [Candidatus Neomarinimicrobiota bacterium]